MYSLQKNLIEYSDSDYIFNKQDRVLTLKFIYMLNEEAIAWASKKQQCVAMFTVKSEYIALCKMIKKEV